MAPALPPLARSDLSPASFVPVRIHADARRIGEGGGARFSVILDGVERPAFAVRFHSRLHAYLNVCRHQARELDFGDAHFFDDAYDALVCCHHGARYRPVDGECVAGPCEGGRLTALRLEERDGALWCTGVAPRER
jgi:nitrite reductase/ring-hydroxylating ferredoxin subunit